MNINIQNISFKILTRESIDSLLQSIITIDNDFNLGLEQWDEENYLVELPGKWKFSLYAEYKNTLIGYIICSKKEGSVHIHRLAVNPNFQKIGVGSSLINQLLRIIDYNTQVTLKVKKYNSNAISFYEKHGFIRYGDDGLNYLYKK